MADQKAEGTKKKRDFKSNSPNFRRGRVQQEPRTLKVRRKMENALTGKPIKQNQQ